MGGMKIKPGQQGTFQVHREGHPVKAQLGSDNLTNQDSQTMEQQTQTNNIAEQEMENVIIEDLLQPLLFVIKYTLPFHNTIDYDPKESFCVFVKGSFWRKTCCIFWELIILFRLGILTIPSINSGFLDTPAEDKAGISIVAQIANVVFILFGFLSIYVFWSKTKVKSMCDVLNCALQLAKRIHIREASPSRSKFMKYFVHASWIYVVCYVGMTVVMHTFEAFSITSKYSTHLEDMSIPTNEMEQYRLDFTGIKFTDESPFVKGLMILANSVNIAWWMMSCFLFGTWALFFRQLVKLLYWRIQTKHDLGKCPIIPDEIRTFNKISTAVDKFNQIHGLTILFGIIIVVTYVFFTAKHVFIGLDHLLDMSSGLHLCLSYVPMAVGAIVLAEVPRVAGMFAAIIKEEFGSFREESGDPAESLCGIAIIHFDLTNSNIGVKGVGFFTVSYQFITTTVGVIISYSILMAQLLPRNITTHG